MTTPNPLIDKLQALQDTLPDDCSFTEGYLDKAIAIIRQHTAAQGDVPDYVVNSPILNNNYTPEEGLHSLMGDASARKDEIRETGDGDWLNDTTHENGNYSNKCCECGRIFNGHKRRVSCKFCVDHKAELQRGESCDNEKDAIAHLATEMGRRDRAEFPNALVMPSPMHYQQKATGLVAMLRPYLRTTEPVEISDIGDSPEAMVLQKILDALGIDDVNINSRGLFEDWIRGVSKPVMVSLEKCSDATGLPYGDIIRVLNAAGVQHVD